MTFMEYTAFHLIVGLGYAAAIWRMRGHQISLAEAVASLLALLAWPVAASACLWLRFLKWAEAR